MKSRVIDLQEAHDKTPAMNQWTKHFLVYSSGVIFMNAVPFFLIPVYTRAVSPTEFGILELLNRSQDLFLLLITLGIGSALATLYQSQETRERKNLLYSTALGFLGSFALVAIGILITESERISQLLFATRDYSVILAIVLCSTFFEIVFQIAVLYLQSEVRSVFYVSIFVCRASLALVLNIVFAFVFHAGLKGIVYAGLIHSLLACSVALSYTLGQIGVGFDKELMKTIFRFGVPLVPGSLAMFVLNNGDRYFLNIYSTKTEVAVYSVGYKLAAATTTLILVPFLKLWSVKMVTISQQQDGPKTIGKIATYLTATCLAATLVVSLFGTIIIRVASTQNYARAAGIIPIVGVSYVLFAWTVIMDSSFYITHKTSFKPIPLLVSCAVVLPAYAFLIPRYQMWGAAWATLLGFSTFAMVTHFVAQKLYRVPYEYSRLAKMSGVGTATYLLADALFSPCWQLNLVLRCILVLGFLMFLWSGYFSSVDERKILIDEYRNLKVLLSGIATRTPDPL